VRGPDGPASWVASVTKFLEISVEYLTEITTTIPDGTDPAEVAERRAAEAVHARELAKAGRLVRLWRPAGELRSIGIWQAADDAAFQAMMEGLPLHRWMTVKATPLTPHPNDPGPARTA
jgi:muconolactone D-isomerase